MIFFFKKYQGDATVAYYAVAVKLMTLLSVIILTVNITVSAAIAASFSNKEIDKVQKMVQNSSRLIVAITLPAVIGLLLFPEFILHFFWFQLYSGQRGISSVGFRTRVLCFFRIGSCLS